MIKPKTIPRLETRRAQCALCRKRRMVAVPSGLCRECGMQAVFGKIAKGIEGDDFPHYLEPGE